MKTRFINWLILAAIVLPVSCSTPAKLEYLRDLNYDEILEAKPAPELKLKENDELAIQVYSTDPELSAPFNAGSGFTTGGEMDIPLSSNYVVDTRGNIDFPVLGEIPVAGKTLAQVRKDIAGEITSRGYIREPVVKAELKNFTITVLGSTGQSVMKVDGNSINILEVIAEAGGISGDTANIKDVMVVRTENGKRQAYSLNLQKKDLFDSPAFYLQQNDLVYVKPHGKRLSGEGELVLSIVTPILSAMSTVAYLLLWLTK